MGERIKVDRILNLSGLLCPKPSMITEKRLENMLPGEILEVVCSDKTVRMSIPDLCRRANYKLIETREEKGLIYFIIKR